MIKNKKNNNREAEFRVNRGIRAKKVRVIGPDGSNIGVLFLNEALAKAEEFALDLVEVSSGETPTCKILDYGKMKYENSKKEKKKEKRNHEIQLTPKIGVSDLDVKIERARKFLEDGSIVNFVVQFKGRETLHPETGSVILDKISNSLSNVSNIIKSPLMNERRMFMILGPKATS